MINVGEIWWSLPGDSAGFCGKLLERIEQGLVLRQEDQIPFGGVLWEKIGSALGCPVQVLEWGSRDRCPGDFLLKHLFTPKQRALYFPSESYGAYLASLKPARMIVRVTGIRGADMARQWEELIGAYRDAGGRDILLAAECDREAGPRALEHRVNPNQCRSFLLLLAGILNNTQVPAYQAELAMNLSPRDPEVNSELLLQGERLLLDAVAAAREFGIDGERAESAVQQTNLVCLFPKIERCRFAFARRHRAELMLCLPLRSVEGELIDDPMELEVGHINYLIRNKGKLRSLSGAEVIQLCAMVRNKIAHNQQIPYATVVALDRLVPEQI